MLRAARQSYVCWRCLSRTAPAEAASSLKPSSSPSAHHNSGRGLSTARHLRLARPLLSSQDSDGVRIRSESEESYIRQRLRAWEAENPAITPNLLLEAPAPGTVKNALTGVRLEHGYRSDGDMSEDAQPHFDGEELVQASGAAANLEAGDLIEISSQSWRIYLLAICLGKFNGYDHFYTNTGRWFTSYGIKTRFVVKHFIKDPAELQKLIAVLPAVPPAGSLESLNDLGEGPTREAGGHLIHHMAKFEAAARRVHLAYAVNLAAAFEKLTRPEPRLMSLAHIADTLLPANLKRNKKTFPPEVLYAVHMVLSRDDVNFRPLDRAGRTQNSCVFAISTVSDVKNISTVKGLVRTYYEYLAQAAVSDTSSSPLPPAPAFKNFLELARKAIDQSRRNRDWTPHGVIGQSKRRANQPQNEWGDTGMAVIKFLHMWAASDQFSAASRLNWLGGAVLRAINRYGDAEILDKSVGWTFLQEIGRLTPWDIRARHALRLPGVELGLNSGLTVPKSETESIALEPDRLASLRRDFSGSTVYCIDAQDADDIDDGVSIEKAEEGGHWIHVHVADPASRIAPNSCLAARAATLPLTIYLPGHHEPMFGDEVVREAFSLAPNRPSLTFSARVTEAGEIAGYSITPGILRDVVYITPDAVSAALGETGNPISVPAQVFEVGKPPAVLEPASKKMTKLEELSQRQVEELRTLGKLANALEKVCLKKGAMPVFLPRPGVKVSLDDVQMTDYPDGFVRCQGDPYIRISYNSGSGSSLVSSLMKTAGQVAARWCRDRSIPVPYRVSPLAKKNANKLHEFCQHILYPQLTAGRKPSQHQLRTLFALTGGQEISATPGPNFIMGLDLYTKATSPLRRYSDMLVHWQIESALLEEARLGTPLTKTSDQSYLCFSKQDMEDVVFPSLHVRERYITALDNLDGRIEWMLQALLRGWLGDSNSATKLPKTFRFTVNYVVPKVAIMGELDWFGLNAAIEPGDLRGTATMAGIKIGDTFEVEIVDINVTGGEIYVQALRRLEAEQGM
ncbi:hypothetical protein B0T25DRAFT_525196 [Lasiosphaeria hispida]|uniref:RNB domain-containing protein n=1 Tax=Lasiosphaeria hispida TaxID=260671 RepID=A0AAJ0HTT8_9PEZI|nr:hypothetical protein B0T25DRAFT_525196 [Lasiosphaeria hispida]